MKRFIKEKNNIALPFDQPSGFYYRRSIKSLDKFEYEKAVYYINKAIKKDDSNQNYVLDLAGILSEIDHFDDSNNLLFLILQNSQKPIAECYYGLGCNYFGLYDYKKASSCLNKYLKLEPDGEYSQETEILLENIEYDLDLEKDSNEPSAAWHNLLTQGNNKKAIEILSKLSDVSQIEYIIIQNNLTAAYLLESQFEDAKTCCNNVLSIESDNIYALCNMSLIQKRLNNTDEAKRSIMHAIDIGEHNINELLKISIALCELDMHEQITMVFSSILYETPYDLHSKHFQSIAFYNCGKYDKSLENFVFISKFKPNSSVNNWYIKQVQNRISGENNINYLTYTNQVPTNCIYERIKIIHEVLADKDIINPWENKDFKEFIIWALDIKDDDLCSSIISIIAKYAGNDIKRLLLPKLCSRNTSDEMKHNILIILKKIGVKEPFIAILDKSIVEVNVNTFEVANDKCLKYQKNIMKNILSNISNAYDNDFISHIITTWNKISSNDNLFDYKLDSKLWSAVLEYEYILTKKLDVDKNTIVEKYDVDAAEMINLLNKLIDTEGK